MIQVEGPPQRLVHPMAEDCLGARAPQTDNALGVGGDDRLGDGGFVGDVDAVVPALELDDLVTLGLEMTDEVDADETARSGYQRSHGPSC
jgi:hypothetical protein